MPTTRRPLLRITRDITLGLAISAVVLGVAEVALRASGFRYQPLGPLGFNSRGRNRFHPYWFWEPRPGDPVDRCPGERINAAGFRGPQRSVERDRARLRIVTLGDSSTFGVKVCYRQTYPARLEEAIPDSEVLNFGVIGYSAFQGEKLLEGRVLEYQPDVVLLAFGAINEGQPAIGYDVETRFSINSRVRPWLAALRDRLRNWRLVQLLGWLLGDRSGNLDPKEIGRRVAATVNDPEQRQRPNQSVASFERSLERMVELARSRGAEVVFIAPPRRMAEEVRWPPLAAYSAAIERVAKRLDVAFFDVRASFRETPDSDQRLFFDGVHPNRRDHAHYARFVARKLEDLLERRRAASNPL